MTMFLGGGSKILIVEGNDGVYQRHHRTLSQFPGQSIERARTAGEAINILSNDHTFDQVVVDGQTWTPSQADPILRAKAPAEKPSKEAQAKALLAQWVGKQNHDACHYYPDIFRKLCDLFGVDYSKMPVDIPRDQFEAGCVRFQNEIYGER